MTFRLQREEIEALGAAEDNWYKHGAEALKNGTVKVCGLVISGKAYGTKAVSLDDDEQVKVITDALIKYYESKAEEGE